VPEHIRDAKVFNDSTSQLMKIMRLVLEKMINTKKYFGWLANSVAESTSY